MNKQACLELLLITIAAELGLTEEGWTFNVSFDKKLPTVAGAHWEPARRAATIAVLPTKKIREDMGVDADEILYEHALAYTLLHELLHIRFEGHMDESARHDCLHAQPAFEWALDQTADALLRGFIARGIV